LVPAGIQNGLLS